MSDSPLHALHAEVVALIESEKARGQGLDKDLEIKTKVQALRDAVRAEPLKVPVTWDAYRAMSEKRRLAIDPANGTHKEVIIGALVAVYSVYAFMCGTRYHSASIWVPEKMSPSQAAVCTWMIEALAVPDATPCGQRKDVGSLVLQYAWLELSS